MAISAYCSLNLFPPTKVSSSKSPQVTWSRRGEGSWKKEFILGLTWAIIGLEMGELSGSSDVEWALAVDMKSGPPSVIRGPRWSDRRACQPWRVNSLETIVPENLPRPSARRRWETTRFTVAAPPLKGVAKLDAKSCFNL